MSWYYVDVGMQRSNLRCELGWIRTLHLSNPMLDLNSLTDAQSHRPSWLINRNDDMLNRRFESGSVRYLGTDLIK